jgi:hypothetical protein
VKLWLWNEARVPAEIPAEAWLLSQTGGTCPLLWCNPQTGQVEAVPRYTEIPNLLAKKICRGLSIPEMEDENYHSGLPNQPLQRTGGQRRFAAQQLRMRLVIILPRR